MTPLATVRVNRRAAERVASGHPWIYASDVTDRGQATPGDAVRVADAGGRTLGTAHYSSTSQICLRMLSDHTEDIGREFFLRRLQQAADYRARVVSDTDAYRLVHGEGDRLPGLVVDRYADCLVIQTLDQGMDRARDVVIACLQEMFAPRCIVARNDAPVRARESLPLEKTVAAGEAPERVAIRMNGLSFLADLMSGQKTGVFLDQRENYPAAARYARGRALDCFTSTGGFALHLAGRCESVEAVDSSADALGLARENARANEIGSVAFHEANVFDFLAARAAARQRFETVVLDPPAFAKSRANVDAAARGYREINRRAFELLELGGVLVTCSCSHHLSEAMLLDIVAVAALDTGRTVRVLERRTQSRDHPILLTVAETHYLKCLILEVMRP